MTMVCDDNVNQKDFVAKVYEELVMRETDRIKYMVKEAEKEEIPGIQNNLVRHATVINDGTMMIRKPYLSEYKLVFNTQNNELPVIAVLSHEDFRQCLERTDSDNLEKLIGFS